MKQKETSNVVIYLCILLLIMIIAVPPILRVLAPKEEVVSNKNEQKEKIVLLTCNKTSDDGTYQINSKTKFTAGNAKTVTITYTVNTPQQTPEDTTSPDTNIDTPTDDEQPIQEQTVPDTQTQPTVVIADPMIEIFRNLQNIEITETENSFMIVMTPKTVTGNSGISEINNYFGNLTTQEQYYQEQGYTCTTLES